MAELARAGHQADPDSLYNLMFRLRDDGYLEFTATMGGGGAESLDLIRLGSLGRQEVQGWPRPTGVSEADAEALIRALEAYANNPEVPADERQKAGAAATAARDLGVEVAGGVIGSWLRSIGLS